MNIRNAIVSRIESMTGFNRELSIVLPWAPRSGPTFYVVRRAVSWGGNGFFSNVLYALTHIAYAMDKGWIPVVDMRNYRTVYSENEPINGSKNDWEHYFVQRHETREAYRSGRFVLSDAVGRKQEYHPIVESDDVVDLDPVRTEKIRSAISAHLRILPQLESGFSEFWNENFAGKRVLGVHWRGTDKRIPPPGHRPTPHFSEVATAVCEVCEKQRPNLIFLASDENGIREEIERCAGIPVLTADAYRLAQGNGAGLHTSKTGNVRTHHRYLLGLEVLRDAWILSRCNYLVHGHSNVTNAAMLFRDSPYDVRVLVRS